MQRVKVKRFLYRYAVGLEYRYHYGLENVRGTRYAPPHLSIPQNQVGAIANNGLRRQKVH